MTPNAMYTHECGIGQLASDHVDLVKRIAYRLVSGLPESVQVEDLIQAGMLGLLEAQKRYSDDEGASFATFAGIRIRGAMLDEIRRGDWTPRSVHRASRAAADARSRLEHRWNRPANDNEIATELGLTLANHQKNQADAACAQLGSLDATGSDGAPFEMPVADAGDLPSEAVEQQCLVADVQHASQSLPERERRLLELYYEQDYKLRDIAEQLGVSESRACQLHGRAVARVRERLGGWAA